MSGGLGYVILFTFAIIFIGISFLVSKKFPVEGVDDFVVGGRTIPFGLVAASVMVSWVWTTTIMGASEAGTWFGVSGGINYSLGAIIPFFIFIPLVVALRRKMPKCTTFTEFVRERYGPRVSTIFLIFGIGIVLYVFTEQGVGIGIAFNTIFGIPYALGGTIPLAIVTAYIAKAGLRGSIFNDLIQFFIISLIMLISVPIILNHVGIHNLHSGLVDVATNPNNVNYNPDALNMGSSAGLRYGMVAAVVAMGQVLFDQGYYSKAIAAASTKSLMRAYLIGTVFAWAPVPILSGNVFGCSIISLGIGEGAGISVLSEAAPYMMTLVYGTGLGSIFFILMVFMAGLTTGGNCLVGAQALFSVDVYKRINKEATEEQQLKFGKRVTIVLGAVVIVAVILLEGVSLLELDIFSGILFAAPTSAFIAGMMSRRTPPSVAVASIFIGLGSGVAAWLIIENQDINWFVGNMLALFLPAVVVILGSMFTKYRFDFNKLMNYEPSHSVAASKEV